MALILPPSLFPPPTRGTNHTLRIPGAVTIGQLTHFVTAKHSQIDLNTFRDYQIAINGFQHLINTQVNNDILDDLAQQGATVILETGGLSNWHLEKGQVAVRTNPVTGITEYLLQPQGIRIQLLNHTVLVPNAYQVPTPRSKIIVSSGGNRVIPAPKGLSTTATTAKSSPAPTPQTAQAQSRQLLASALLAYTSKPHPPKSHILTDMLKAGGYNRTPRYPTDDDKGKQALLSRGGTEGNVWEGTVKTNESGGRFSPSRAGYVLKVSSSGPLNGHEIIIQPGEVLYFAKDK